MKITAHQNRGKTIITLFPVVALVCAALLFIGTASAQVIDVQPGEVSRFDVEVPSGVVAGEPFGVRIVARDAQGNIVTDYARSGAGVRLDLVPGAQSGVSLIEPSRFTAGQFQNGVLQARIKARRAGTFQLQVSDLSGKASARSEAFAVEAGAVSEIRVLAPETAKVNEPFDASIELFDVQGNLVRDFDRRGGEVQLSPADAGSSGRFEPSTISASFFTAGRANINLRYTSAERVVLEARSRNAVGRSTPINIRAGALAAIKFTLPSEPVFAGEPFRIGLEAVDATGNAIRDFAASGEVVELSSTGAADFTPRAVPASAFADGSAVVEARYSGAEPIRILARRRNGSILAESSRTVDVRPGRVGRLDVVVAQEAVVGNPAAIQITAWDLYGNRIEDMRGRNIRIEITRTDGARLEAPVLAAGNFEAGVAFAGVTPLQTGAMILTVTDRITGVQARSNRVEVRAASAAEFLIRVPTAAQAHEAFAAEIIARDRFGNVVRNYARTGGAVIVERTGAGNIIPDVIPASAFVDGIARVEFTYNIAEQIRISLVEQGGTASGTSEPVLITSAEPARFVLDVPATAVAGKPLSIAIRAEDEFGNVAGGYGQRDAQIALFSDDGIPLAPPAISSKLFRQGRANVEILFLASGIARVVAEEVGSGITGTSSEVRVIAGPPARLVVRAPATVTAGEKFTVRFEMQDRLGNRILDYSPPAASYSARVVPISDGNYDASSVTLDNISGMLFREGVAEVVLSARASGSFRLEVTDEQLNIRGRSAPVVIVPSAAESFRVEVLDQNGLRAGEPIRVLVVAEDALGNRVTTFGENGEVVALEAEVVRDGVRSSASGMLHPRHLLGELFRNGAAEVYVLYNKAEPIVISASPLSNGAGVKREVIVVADENIPGGTRLSLISNGKVQADDGARLQESLLSVFVPDAGLSPLAPRAQRISSDIVSLVTLSPSGRGTQMLVHTEQASTLRVAPDANRLIVDVEPAVSTSTPPVTFLNPVAPTYPEPARYEPAPNRPGERITMTDVNNALRAGETVRALALVNAMLEARPGDADLLSLRHRIEVLLGLELGSPSDARPQPVTQPAPPPRSTNIPLQVPEERLESPAGSMGSTSVESAIRAGNYEEALRLLDRRLTNSPQDIEAQRMRQRILQLIELMHGSQEGGVE